MESEFRFPERLPNEQGLLQAVEQHSGFSRDSIVQKQEHRSEEHTSELQSLTNLVCRLLLEKKKKKKEKKRKRKKEKEKKEKEKEKKKKKKKKENRK